MSSVRIIAFRNDVPSTEAELRNAWGGHMRIWNAVYDRYFKRGEYDSCLGNADVLWAFPKTHRSVERAVHAVLISTFDWALVMADDFDQYIADLVRFEELFLAGDRVSHLAAYRSFIDGNRDAQAIGFHGTSVSEDPWTISIDEESYRSYSLATDDKHFGVYEHLRELEGVASDAPA